MSKKPWTRNQKLLLLAAIVGFGTWFAKIEINIGSLEGQVAEIRLDSGYCIYEDKTTTTPNITMGVCPGESGVMCARYFESNTTTTERCYFKDAQPELENKTR